MGNTIYEFMTHWDSPRPIWFKRDEEELIGTQRGGGRAMPRIRVFDLLQGPTNRAGFKAAGVNLSIRLFQDFNDPKEADAL